MSVLVDANVILDLFEDDPVWAQWSLDRLEEHAAGALLINSIIYAEVSIGFARIEELEAALDKGGFKMAAIPREALFLAGKAYLNYRRAGGNRTLPLPDFFIAAHARVGDMPLLTRDAKRFSSYFPGLKLITPDKQ